MYAPYQPSSVSSPYSEAQQAREVLAKIAKSRCVWGDGRGIDDMDGPPLPLSSTMMLFSNDDITKKDDEVEDEDTVDEQVDTFTASSSTMPRRVGSDRDVTPVVVLEVAPRNGRLQTNDPLFHGVCLYDGCMTTDQRERVEYHTRTNGSTTENTSLLSSPSSWTSSLASVFSTTSP